jgi:acyl-CoA thioesterase II
MFTMDAFVEALTLEPVAEDRYRATSVPSDYGMVWGGQLLAQSVMGALAGQDGKAVKTLHAVFARPAKADAPLDVAVDRMHSGRSLASSTITISQDEQIITRALALLSAEEPDVIRHADSPRLSSHPDDVAGVLNVNGAWESGAVGAVDISDPDLIGPPELDVWARFVGAPDDPAVDQALLAFSTETFLIGTAMRPHDGVGQAQAHVTLSTGVLTHTITYHEPCRAAEWHLLQMRASYTGHGRSFGRGDIFDLEGRLVGSFVQDAMIRARSGGAGKL